MAVHTLQSGAPGLELVGGNYLRLEAIDPVTGAAVTGVTVSSIAVYGVNLKGYGEGETIPVGPFRLVPG